MGTKPKPPGFNSAKWGEKQQNHGLYLADGGLNPDNWPLFSI
jgi:hypothetical protein